MAATNLAIGVGRLLHVYSSPESLRHRWENLTPAADSPAQVCSQRANQSRSRLPLLGGDLFHPPPETEARIPHHSPADTDTHRSRLLADQTWLSFSLSLTHGVYGVHAPRGVVSLTLSQSLCVSLLSLSCIPRRRAPNRWRVTRGEKRQQWRREGHETKRARPKSGPRTAQTAEQKSTRTRQAGSPVLPCSTHTEASTSTAAQSPRMWVSATF